MYSWFTQRLVCYCQFDLSFYTMPRALILKGTFHFIRSTPSVSIKNRSCYFLKREMRNQSVWFSNFMVLNLDILEVLLCQLQLGDRSMPSQMIYKPYHTLQLSTSLQKNSTFFPMPKVIWEDFSNFFQCTLGTNS